MLSHRVGQTTLHISQFEPRMFSDIGQRASC